MIGRLPRTKFHPPLPLGDLIPREQLLRTLHDALLTHPFTLLSAPAGYGKTTTLAALARAFPGLSLAWLSLEREDNDPLRFLTALLGALGYLDSSFQAQADGATAQSLLTDLTEPLAEMLPIVGSLINDVMASQLDPLVLVLDDLHLINDPLVLASLDYLLGRLPPQMRLVVSTRRMPSLALARLRARGQMAELGPGDLRFSLDEATLFLNGRLRLNISLADLISLHERTEGWPAGLRLLACSLDRAAAPDERASSIAYLLRTERHIFDFWADEVLNRQSETVRTFLLDTSILAELTVPLCRAVTGRDDAAAILEDLHRRNLFVAALDPFRTVFRYHALFAEFLRRRLERERPERAVELHRRAAEAQADTHPHRAIGHYLAAEMWDEAAALVERIGKGRLHRHWVNIPAGWSHAPPPSVYKAHPRLVHFLGVCTWLEGNVKGAMRLIERALHAFEELGDEQGQGEALTDLTLCALMEADLVASSEGVQRAPDFPLALPDRVQLLMGRAWLGLVRGDTAQAKANFDAAMALVRANDDQDAIYLLAMCLSALFIVLPGALEQIEYLARRITSSAEGTVSPALVAAEGLMAFTHMWRGRLEQGIQAGERALAVSRRLGGFPFVDIEVVTFMAVAHAARGDDVAAERFFDRLFHERKWVPLDEAYTAAYLYLLGRTRWMQGRLEEMRRVYAQMEAEANPREIPFAPTLRLMMRGLLAMAEHRYAEAEQVLRQAVEGELADPVVALFGSARLMLARLHLEQNRPHDALAELTSVLEECQRNGTPGLILKEGAAVVPLLRLAMERGVYAPFAAHLLHILGADEKPRPVRIPETGEVLTSREVEVLRLIAAGETNRAIAGQLLISPETVKSHVSRILHKMNVSSRTRAAVRARELGIVSAHS